MGKSVVYRERGKAGTHQPTPWGSGQSCPKDLPGAFWMSQNCATISPKNPAGIA